MAPSRLGAAYLLLPSSEYFMNDRPAVDQPIRSAVGPG